MYKKTINYYCDESCHLENDASQLMGISFVSCPLQSVHVHNREIREIIDKHKKRGEFKWTNISRTNLPLYNEIVDYFFRQSDLEFRALVIQKNEKFKEEGPDNVYYKAMYRLIYHKLDLFAKYTVYTDQKDTLSAGRLKHLREILANKCDNFSKIQVIRSSDSVLLQLSDLLLGAVIRAFTKGDDGSFAKVALIRRLKEKHNVDLWGKDGLENSKFEVYELPL